MATDAAAYREYVSARLDTLRRTAYLLCGNWHTADDVVSTVLGKLYRHWSRVSRMDSPDGYVHRMLTRAVLDERRRPWRREHSAAVPPDRPGGADPAAGTDRMVLMALLAELPPKRRAVLVLRYFCDLSVEATAEALHCSAGTVKSQTHRALADLRTRMAVTTPEDDGPARPTPYLAARTPFGGDRLAYAHDKESPWT